MMVSSFVIGTTLTIALSGFRPKEKHFRRAAQIWAKFLLLCSGIKAKVEGIENLPKNEPLIFVANHQSAADIVLLLACTPRYFRFAPKKELFNIPIFGSYLKWSGYMPVDRESGRKAIKSLAGAEEFLKDEEAILIFPEGTRSPDGVLKEFKRGSLFLIFKSKVKVIPVGICGSYKIIDKGSALVKPTTVIMKYGKPLSFENYSRTRADYAKGIEILTATINKML
ncbi:lysophospholipid acyltransferase family protein [Candidatus Margulisiibacteriota bacterium]